MKKITFIVLLLAAVLLIVPVSAYAKDNSARKAAKATQKINKQIAKQIKKADKKIAKDLRKIEGLIERVNESSRLTAEQKTTLLASLNADIAYLTALKSKIDSATDMATLREDIKKITPLGRIMGHYLPMIKGKGKIVDTDATEIEEPETEED